MPSGNREVIASTIFVPDVEGVVTAYKRNLSGTAGVNPTRISIGHYACLVPEDLDELHSSITTHATNASGQTRDVSVLIARDTPVTATTRLDIFIRGEEFAETEDHLIADTVIVAGGGFASILSTTIVLAEAARVDIEFTFAGQTSGASATFIGRLIDNGVVLDVFSNGTSETSAATDEPTSGAIKRSVILLSGTHIIEVEADASGANFEINANTNPDQNHGSLVVSVQGGQLTDDANFVEATISRLPQ